MVAGALLTFGAHATSWQDSLSSAANQLSSQSGSQQSGGMSLSSLTGLLNGGSQSLTSSSMNNAARDYVLLRETEAGFGYQYRKR